MNVSDRIIRGDLRAVARAISWAENGHPDREKLIDAIYPHCGNALILGLTGPPGSGKSCLLNQLLVRERLQDKRVAVIAVDPSSPFTGGALLGDRLRMQQHAADDSVFIRSMASRGHLGGVAGATADAIKILDAAGYDLIIVETLGVGQTEIDIARLADMVLLVLVPGLGDEIQALKAGVMEIGDIFIINKSDKPESARVRAEVEYVLSLKAEDHPETMHPIVLTSATLNRGIDHLVETIHRYANTIAQNGLLQKKRKHRLFQEIENVLVAKVYRRVARFFDSDQIQQWVRLIQQGQAAPYQLIEEKLSDFYKEVSE